ncbi:MAG: hypothetical protein RIA64_08885 [Rhodospirillales bacterium]
MMVAARSNSNKFTGLALGLMALATAFTMTASPAMAQLSLKIGQCGKPAAVMQAVAKEGHGFIANMNADLVASGTSQFVKREHIVTATGNGSHWYMFSGNGAIGKSSELCLAMKGTDLEINHNYDNDLASTTSALAYDRDDALLGCYKIHQQRGANTVCNDRDTLLKGFKQKSEQNLMLQGTIETRSGRTSTMMSLIVDPANQEDYRILVTIKDSGATTIAQRGTDANLSPRVVGEIKK